MKLKIRDVLPNPFRDLKGNPPLPEKIAELKDSINATGFWDNVVVRKNKDGKYERAYGEHRCRAAIEAGVTEADFIVKDLDDAMMIKIMDNENREVYASSPASLIESVKAVVQALAEGQIPPFELNPKTNIQQIRYAPSYVPGVDAHGTSVRIPYTAFNIAAFLGRTEKRSTGRDQASDAITAALNALHLKEIGHFSDKMLVTKDKTGAPKPITTNELLVLTTGIKKHVEQNLLGEKAYRAKIAKEQEASIKLQRETAAEAKRIEEEDKTLRRKLAAARKDKNQREAKRLMEQQKEAAERAEEYAEENKLRMAEINERVAKVHAEEEARRIEANYAPTRKMVSAMEQALKNIVSEHNPMRESVKALAKCKDIRPEDRKRLQESARDVADWYYDWVAPQFAPELKADQHRAVNARKAKEKR